MIVVILNMNIYDKIKKFFINKIDEWQLRIFTKHLSIGELYHET